MLALSLNFQNQGLETAVTILWASHGDSEGTA